MFFYCFCIIFALGHLPVRAFSQEKVHELKQSECMAKQGDCDDRDGPVCGSDNQTYPTHCHLLRVQRCGYQVNLKYRGSCKVLACFEARQNARSQGNPKMYLPHCRKDGNYAAMQCQSGTGCWCSDSAGNRIANTTGSSTTKPLCRQHRRNSRRRASMRQLSPMDNGVRLPCNKTDRAAFNGRLLELFRSEYLRAEPLQPSSDAAVLDWKFSHLDANSNQMLDKQEVRELKKLVKRVVEPKRCGRAFGKYCDINRDEGLSRLEWSNCLAKDGKNRNVAGKVPGRSAAAAAGGGGGSSSSTTATARRMQLHYANPHTSIHTSNPRHDHTNTNTIGSSVSPSAAAAAAAALDQFGDERRLPTADYEDDYENEDSNEDESGGGGGGGGGGTNNNSSRRTLNHPPSFYFLNPITEATSNEPESDTNCWADQVVAKEEQRLGGYSLFYVPECTQDGRYQRVQCYRSTPYCWCVNEDTGKNIPGTSMKHKRPQCDELAVPRPMKGCTEPRKSIFLKQLKEFFKTQAFSRSSSNAGLNNNNNSSMWKTEDERIAAISFQFLDKNSDQIWERKEWKVFRELVSSARNLRKCGKKMPRYCDANGDRKISLSEWIDCLQPQRTENATTAKPIRSNETATSRLLGSNPLEQYLKD